MSPDPAQPVLSRRALRFAGLTAATLAVVIVIMGIATRKMADARLSEWTENQAIPVVAVATPDTKAKQTSIDLPGRLEAYSQAQIFARVSGYVKEWKADIGTPVKAGQVLAEIDAPDLDQQIMQAQADVASAQANLTLSNANLQRGQSLIQSGAVSKQDLDQRIADSSNKLGLLKSAQANLDRLRVLEKYKRIVAPFDGLVTARATDVGALINAGAGGGPALFVVSDTSKLRAYVNVPQKYVPSITIGTQAQIAVPEYPGRTFPATVEASSQSVDVASGTTRMLLVVDNAKGELMTGAFANVRLQLAGPDRTISVPASALIFDQSGLRVATVEPDDRVVLKPVTIARDLGKEVEIASGLSADDRVIQSPPDGIAEGDRVRIAPDSPSAAPATASAK
ncbi:MAG TPA: efflux RND transporter periplasmic adaptor subunit [Xanthobacteraceae bacterium]|jgi:RND family efflux transporter MFP subunit|nr:efflux RND transporter periplasmic adaptor subunit [Xanthobacteraceae bacterium]